jgi:nitrite reductase/ring-hydroxylating ferredoxin subunit
MPIQGRVFRLFGQQFIEDHESKQVKCNKCPHKGIDLTDAPTIDGIVVCPAHGMRFKDNLCVFDEQDKAYKL